jgi:hypothetical protein
LGRREITEITEIIEIIQIIEITEIIDGKGIFISVYLPVNKEGKNIEL